MTRLTGKVEKGWGSEDIWISNDLYCSKFMHFDEGAQFSMHFHAKKTETWYVQSGSFCVWYLNTMTASKYAYELNKGDTWTNEVCEPHQLEALEDDSVIFEVSTPDDPRDSYRVEKGNSQS
jgi:hypothetical protein